ncbi:MAG: asparagine synthase (glutamine-hydrolyzing) [Planctomycetes bacterium]|nr:asparagine synthase (glutamine-hydrolyzing) [Planctomycetota bacterium]
MCGICGIYHRDPSAAVSRETLRAMIARLRHRGPDDAGTFLRGELPAAGGPGDTAGTSLAGPASRATPGLNVGLGMARLSIIDVMGGHQPMSNEDGSVWVVFNGEVYNFRELKGELLERGHAFRSHADTEVIVHLYEELGERVVERLHGMFAFALWDERREQLLLARDRLGKKPLVYHDDGARIAFASELQALLEAPGITRAVSPEALDLYLTYQYVPAPLTIFEGIRKLPPAHYLVASKGGTRIERYWDLPTAVGGASLPRASDASASPACLRERLDAAVKMRLVSDVPLGAFLSGGIDSTIVVGLMARHMREPVKTFSIGFGQPKYDELSYARLAAERFGTDHHEFVVEPKAIEVLPLLVRHYGEPFADSSAIPTYYLAQKTREHVTVALSGDGGDEGFGGYERYAAMALGARYDALPRPLRCVVRGLARALFGRVSTAEPKSRGRRLRRFVEALSLPQVERYVQWIAYFKQADKGELYTGAFAERLGRDISDFQFPISDLGLKSAIGNRQSAMAADAAARYLAAEFAKAGGLDAAAATARVDAATYLPNDILTKVDIASMANSLEVRCPFLEPDVLGFGLSLPTRLKLGRLGISTKKFLRAAFADLLPPAIRTRGKMGFGVPIAHWLRGELRDYARCILLSPECLARGYFREETVRRLLDEHQSSRADHADRLWALLNLELWHREFLP